MEKIMLEEGQKKRRTLSKKRLVAPTIGPEGLSRGAIYSTLLYSTLLKVNSAIRNEFPRSEMSLSKSPL